MLNLSFAEIIMCVNIK